MVIRFAEQFLIRAEARTYLNNLNGALVDLNKIRTRAGLDEFESESKEIILESIYKERKKSFFQNGDIIGLTLKEPNVLK